MARIVANANGTAAKAMESTLTFVSTNGIRPARFNSQLMLTPIRREALLSGRQHGQISPRVRVFGADAVSGRSTARSADRVLAAASARGIARRPPQSVEPQPAR